MRKPTRSELEIARSHVAQAERRIAQQTAIVVELGESADLARRTLATLKQSLDIAREHVRRLERQSGDGSA